MQVLHVKYILFCIWPTNCYFMFLLYVFQVLFFSLLKLN